LTPIPPLTSALPFDISVKMNRATICINSLSLDASSDYRRKDQPEDQSDDEDSSVCIGEEVRREDLDSDQEPSSVDLNGPPNYRNSTAKCIRRPVRCNSVIHPVRGCRPTCPGTRNDRNFAKGENNNRSSTTSLKSSKGMLPPPPLLVGNAL